MTDGREDYLRYYYLWHLIAIGVLKAKKPYSAPQSCPEIEEVIWEKETFQRDSAKIALIDMGIARFHPNLDPKIGGADPQMSRVLWDDALDLASHRYGAKYLTAIANRHLEERARHLSGIDITIIPGPDADESKILDEIKQGCGVNRQVKVYNQSYTSHGTCCAGLLCGTSFSDDQFGNQGDSIVYYGVDPYSQIVPITTSISPDPKQLIAAFLYAHSLEVDVILLPRDAADPLTLPRYGELDGNEKTRLHNPGPLDPAWTLLKKVIERVSKDIPVVCAAGNDARSELIYPASLAGDPANGVIAVGAVSYAGYRSGYSSYGRDLTVVAPSGDGEVYNRHQVRLDRKTVDATQFWIEGIGAPAHEQLHQCPIIPRIDFSPERLVSLDVPGPRGYAAAGRRGPVLDRLESVDDARALYTEFGGTSGAAALVAGVVALIQRKKNGRMTGPQVKDILAPVAGPSVDIEHWYWLEGVRDELELDAVNGLPQPTPEELFGAGGLVNVPSPLAAVP